MLLKIHALHSPAGSSVFPPLYPITLRVCVRDAFFLVYGGLKALSWELYAFTYLFFVQACKEEERRLHQSVPAAPGGLPDSVVKT